VTTAVRLPRRLLLVVVAMFAVVAMAPATASATWSKGGSFTELTPNAATVEALVGLGVTPSPAPGNNPADSFRFPITNSFASAIVNRQIRHKGGINLTAGDTVVTLRNFNINTGWKPNVTGQVLVNGTFPLGEAPIKLLNLSFKGTKVAFGGGYLRVGPVTGTLSSEAAGALTLVFGAPDLTGVELGTLQINRKF
jgi:hypothetical protein